MSIMASDMAARGIRLLDMLELLDVLLPELTTGRGVAQPETYHHYDVFDHGIEALAVLDLLLGRREPEDRAGKAIRREFWETLGAFDLASYFGTAIGGHSILALTKLATLLHDVAKPATRTEDAGGRVRFLGHSEEGARVAAAVCKRLRMGGRETAFVARLVEEHLRPAQISQSGSPTDRAIFRFSRALGDGAKACLVLSLADAASAIGPSLTVERFKGHLAYIRYVLERMASQGEVVRGRHFVSGDTLIRALDIRPGPEVGRLLAAIDEAAASGDVSSDEEAIELARDLRSTGEIDNRAGVA
jgi:poly(A) polymerase